MEIFKLDARVARNVVYIKKKKEKEERKRSVVRVLQRNTLEETSVSIRSFPVSLPLSFPFHRENPLSLFPRFVCPWSLDCRLLGLANFGNKWREARATPAPRCPIEIIPGENCINATVACEISFEIKRSVFTGLPRSPASVTSDKSHTTGCCFFLSFLSARKRERPFSNGIFLASFQRPLSFVLRGRN